VPTIPFLTGITFIPSDPKMACETIFPCYFNSHYIKAM